MLSLSPSFYCAGMDEIKLFLSFHVHACWGHGAQSLDDVFAQAPSPPPSQSQTVGGGSSPGDEGGEHAGDDVVDLFVSLLNV